jgi:hypothetical protein
MKPHHIPALLTLVASLVLAGCHGHHGGPSDARMAQQIAAQFNKEFGGNLVQVLNLKESQGHITAKGHYIALVHFDMKFTKSLAEVRQQDADQGQELYVLFDQFNAGDTRPITDEVLFAKTDQGWVLIKSKQRR